MPAAGSANQTSMALETLSATAESVLTYWMNLSILALTTAMIFYHVARHNDIRADKRLAAAIAITLLGTGVVYLSVAVFNYIPRTDDVVRGCRISELCSQERENRLYLTRQLNVGMAAATLVTECVIAYLIYNAI
jgi:hypothetical protein